MSALLGTTFIWLFGAWDLSLMILVTTMALDYVTGITRGYVNKQLSSEYGFRGLAKKLTIFYVIILSVLIDRLIGQGWIFRTLVCFWYTSNEGASILENVAAIGLPVPEKLVDALAQLKEGNKKYNEVK
ncbi:phage holin family protein [Terrisporobacter hibernicus]|uniref:Phage holin family protein n=2 Tax=Terrisporobacter hibernicus TaxID=2813371 RepID=A0AAX2ZLC9_9FIRM|nr:phage holin family protein [Terrisporobacter hibernicus]UEL49851.1 phage holin family protein [Terrisporobacter hibernicus]